jgi:ribonuclease HI
MGALELWTDGMCWPNPGPTGAWGAILVAFDDDGIEVAKRELSGRVEGACTNQRMEILAVIEGLRRIDRPSEVTIFSDSQYVVKTMTCGWKRKKNIDLWDALDRVAEPHSVRYRWVKGHAGVVLNERADVLAEIASWGDE